MEFLIVASVGADTNLRLKSQYFTACIGRETSVPNEVRGMQGQGTFSEKVLRKNKLFQKNVIGKVGEKICLK